VSETYTFCFYLFFLPTATVRKFDAIQRSQLSDFGKYVAECLPKYVQKVQLTAGDELELLIAPEGIIPILQFLKDHHNTQFSNLVDIAGMDVPTRQYRFEVKLQLWRAGRVKKKCSILSCILCIKCTYCLSICLHVSCLKIHCEFLQDLVFE
jgi:hypothetical protein